MRASDCTDFSLLQRIAARDTAALAELYDRHNRLVFGLILRIVGDRGEAEDILQDTFVRVWNRADIYDARIAGPLPWIVRVARNRAIDRLRARRVRAAVDAPATDVATIEPAAAIQSPEAAVLDAERRLRLSDALAASRWNSAADRGGLLRGLYPHRNRATLRAAAGDREDPHPHRPDRHAPGAGARRMIPADIQALALADAVGALDPDERRDLEARLTALPPAVRAEVAHLYDASVEVAASALGEEPSPAVRAALLAKIGVPANHTITAAEGAWVETGVPGVRAKILAIDRMRDRVTMLVKADPGARYPAHRHSGPEECYVISGSVVVEGRLLRAGDFHHAEGESDHDELWTDDGVEVLIVASASDYAA